MKLLFAYLATGIISSLASIYWNDAVVSVGASGAIFGLCGVFLALYATKALPHYFDPDLKSILIGMMIAFVGCNLVMGIMGNVDNAGHIGGLVSGFILGLLQSLIHHLQPYGFQNEDSKDAGTKNPSPKRKYF
jgi:membrane associated rhomboid family serine protease